LRKKVSLKEVDEVISECGRTIKKTRDFINEMEKEMSRAVGQFNKPHVVFRGLRIYFPEEILKINSVNPGSEIAKNQLFEILKSHALKINPAKVIRFLTRGSNGNQRKGKWKRKVH